MTERKYICYEIRTNNNEIKEVKNEIHLENVVGIMCIIV